VLFINISGKWYPPKNNIAVILLNNTIELYSARKKKTKGTEECSVKNPATNSDSRISFNFKLLNCLVFVYNIYLKKSFPDFKYRPTLPLNTLYSAAIST
jgi:hypothetical protein